MPRPWKEIRADQRKSATTSSDLVRDAQISIWFGWMFGSYSNVMACVHLKVKHTTRLRIVRCLCTPPKCLPPFCCQVICRLGPPNLHGPPQLDSQMGGKGCQAAQVNHQGMTLCCDFTVEGDTFRSAQICDDLLRFAQTYADL